MEMNKKCLFAALGLVVACALSPIYGQGVSTTSKKNADANFGYRLWYGTHVTLGFNGGYGESLFTFGLAPMVGYKVLPWLSAGPRAYFLYYNYRVDFGGGRIEKINPTEWGAGAFLRIHPIQTFFAQVEYDYENEPLISYDGQMLVADRRTRGAGYVGLGYSSRGGGPWGFEVLLMYNFNQPSNTIESPLDYRAGVTYNF
mgnify:CR=1 FL=1